MQGDPSHRSDQTAQWTELLPLTSSFLPLKVYLTLSSHLLHCEAKEYWHFLFLLYQFKRVILLQIENQTENKFPFGEKK